MRIKGTNAHKSKFNKVKPFRLRDDGYCDIQFCKNYKQTTYLVHKIVYKSFYGDYDELLYEINHIDENRSNNKLSNLELLTRVENIRYSTEKRDLPHGLYECNLRGYEYYVVDVRNKNIRFTKSFNKKNSNALEQALLFLEESEYKLGIKQAY